MNIKKIDDRRIGLVRLLKESRKNKGLNQTKVGEELGVVINTISGYESGCRLPDIDYLIKFSKLVDVDLVKFLEARVIASEYFSGENFIIEKKNSNDAGEEKRESVDVSNKDSNDEMVTIKKSEYEGLMKELAHADMLYGRAVRKLKELQKNN